MNPSFQLLLRCRREESKLQLLKVSVNGLKTSHWPDELFLNEQSTIKLIIKPKNGWFISTLLFCCCCSCQDVEVKLFTSFSFVNYPSVQLNVCTDWVCFSLLFSPLVSDLRWRSFLQKFLPLSPFFPVQTDSGPYLRRDFQDGRGALTSKLWNALREIYLWL